MFGRLLKHFLQCFNLEWASICFTTITQLVSRLMQGISTGIDLYSMIEILHWWETSTIVSVRIVYELAGILARVR